MIACYSLKPKHRKRLCHWREMRIHLKFMEHGANTKEWTTVKFHTKSEICCFLMLAVFFSLRILKLRFFIIICTECWWKDHRHHFASYFIWIENFVWIFSLFIWVLRACSSFALFSFYHSLACFLSLWIAFSCSLLAVAHICITEYTISIMPQKKKNIWPGDKHSQMRASNTWNRKWNVPYHWWKVFLCVFVFCLHSSLWILMRIMLWYGNSFARWNTLSSLWRNSCKWNLMKWNEWAILWAATPQGSNFSLPLSLSPSLSVYRRAPYRLI